MHCCCCCCWQCCNFCYSTILFAQFSLIKLIFMVKWSSGLWCHCTCFLVYYWTTPFDYILCVCVVFCCFALLLLVLLLLHSTDVAKLFSLEFLLLLLLMLLLLPLLLLPQPLLLIALLLCLFYWIYFSFNYIAIYALLQVHISSRETTILLLKNFKLMHKVYSKIVACTVIYMKLNEP